MKTPEEMAAYFRSMPKKERINPYWEFDQERELIRKRNSSAVIPEDLKDILYAARQYFRLVYESFGTESQVLCVSAEDTDKLRLEGVPYIEDMWDVMGFRMGMFVLPQMNTPGSSVISEAFWQKYIVEKGIVPIMRIHSHHMLNAYQSQTDYSTLNSGTLEIVMGRIMEKGLRFAYWLDEHGKDTKGYVFQAEECPDGHMAIYNLPGGNGIMMHGRKTK